MQEIRKALVLFSSPILSKASAISGTLGATTSAAARPALTAYNSRKNCNKIQNININKLILPERKNDEAD